MRFFHFSDLHFRTKLSTSEDTLRDSLLNEIKKVIDTPEFGGMADALFFTGDYCWAPDVDSLDQMKDRAKEIAEYICKIAEIAKINRSDFYKRIHVVPGNHDALRHGSRIYATKKIIGGTYYANNKTGEIYLTQEEAGDSPHEYVVGKNAKMIEDGIIDSDYNFFSDFEFFKYLINELYCHGAKGKECAHSILHEWCATEDFTNRSKPHIRVPHRLAFDFDEVNLLMLNTAMFSISSGGEPYLLIGHSYLDVLIDTIPEHRKSLPTHSIGSSWFRIP